MRNWHLFGTTIVGVLLLVFLPGCGKSNAKMNDLKELHLLYQSASDKAIGDKKLVARAADLKDAPNITADQKKLIERVGSDGDYVFIWSVDFGSMKADGKELGDYILGYESATPKEGGYVVYCDGVVKKLTADEFKSAKKAEPSKK